MEKRLIVVDVQYLLLLSLSIIVVIIVNIAAVAIVVAGFDCVIVPLVALVLVVDGHLLLVNEENNHQRKRELA